MLMNRIFGIALLVSCCFGGFYGQNKFLFADDFFATTSLFNSYIEPKCNASNFGKYASIAYRIYVNSSYYGEGNNVMPVSKTKFYMQFYFDTDIHNNDEINRITFYFSENSNDVFVTESSESSVKLYIDNNDCFYKELYSLFQTNYTFNYRYF